MSVLLRIAEDRKLSVEDAKTKVSIEDLKSRLRQYQLVNFHQRVLDDLSNGKQQISLFAEIKRASPSKGILNKDVNVSHTARTYAYAGASTISVLTESKYFLGTLEDMELARVSVDTIPNRPAILRKDFVVDEYQIYEARVHGADTVLLIVAILAEDKLKEYIAISRSLGMEPLVEVANESEMQTALKQGARVIGINNRNLHDFTVDMNTTTKLLEYKEQFFQSGSEEGELLPTIFIALSGITCASDVKYFVTSGVSGILVGETLMKSEDPFKKAQSLIAMDDNYSPSNDKNETFTSSFVKICGIKDTKIATETLKTKIKTNNNNDNNNNNEEIGVDFLGLVFAKKSSRYVTIEKAKEIVTHVRGSTDNNNTDTTTTITTTHDRSHISPLLLGPMKIKESLRSRKPLVVGVFADNEPEFINEVIDQVGIDIVQLSGNEDINDMMNKLERISNTTNNNDKNKKKKKEIFVWKTIHVSSTDDPKLILQNLSPLANYNHNNLINKNNNTTNNNNNNSLFFAGILLDTKDANMKGGTGKAFDWSIARYLQFHYPIILAGGLNPENIRSAVNQVRPFAVDVSSGVESGGEKDPLKISLFISHTKQQ
eukprot:TRINITY_DN1760_c1_g1_i5.p1 TRINITY_DN1760_c1_g1~~TRINITY_DN1760_c1_g1_i5.p1  ORF type:complete len:601 (-),score=154.22 TRINITY_DN1760_c1_g1_i5:20-1822(-)